MKNKFKKVMLFWELYYPIILAFISFLYSVSLWFSGNEVRRNICWYLGTINTSGIGCYKTKKTSVRDIIQREELIIKEEEMVTGNMLVMFIVGFIIFCFYLFGLLYSIYWGHNS